MKAIVSILIHEKPEVVLDQIANINKFFPEAEVVLHVSKGYFQNYELTPLENIAGVYLNPIHLETQWGDLLLPHLSNFRYIQSLDLNYDYFIMHASNDMYVQYGAAEYISKYAAGFNFHYIRQQYTYWWPSALAWEDPWLAAIMRQCGQTKIVASQVEGSFYRKDIITKIMETIQATIDQGLDQKKKGLYTREEFFFSTIAETMIPYQQVGRPIVFSEVHRFDRELWRAFSRADAVYRKFGHYVLPPRVLDEAKKRYGEKKVKLKEYQTTPQIIDKVRMRDAAYVEDNRYLNDGHTTFELYGSAETLFAVKRVERDCKDPIRQYICGLK